MNEFSQLSCGANEFSQLATIDGVSTAGSSTSLTGVFRGLPETVLLFDFYGQMLSVRLDAIASMTTELAPVWRAESTTSAVTSTVRSHLLISTNDGHQHRLDFGSEPAARQVILAILGRYELPPVVEIFPKGSANPTPPSAQSSQSIPKSFEEV